MTDNTLRSRPLGWQCAWKDFSREICFCPLIVVMYFMALGISRLRVGVPVLQEAVFVSDSAEALTLWTSQGASEATIDKITNDINLHIQSCVFLPYLA